MESFTPHPDLVLLQSLSRELMGNLMEAAQSGNGPELVFHEMDVDQQSMAAFAEYTVDKVCRIIREGDGCPEGYLCGMFLEAFTMGFRYQAEKAVWADAKAFLSKPQDPPAPEAPQG